MDLDRETSAPGRLATTQILTIVGGSAITIGSFLPWVTATHMFGQTSFAGTDGDGAFTLVIGAVVALLAWLRFDSSGGHAGILIGSVFAGLIGLGVISGILADADGSGSEYVLSSVGAGLYIVMIGALLAAAATVAHMRSG